MIRGERGGGGLPRHVLLLAEVNQVPCNKRQILIKICILFLLFLLLFLLTGLEGGGRVGDVRGRLSGPVVCNKEKNKYLALINCKLSVVI